MAGRIGGAFAALVLVVALGAPAHAQALSPVKSELRGCDPIDDAACLYPWPNDYFTRADRSTPTGRRVNLPLSGMPRNVAGKPIDNSDFNRADGFSPGQLIVTKVPGLDTPAAFAATGAVPITDMARYADDEQPIVVLDTVTGRRHPIWAELDANPADPKDVTLLIRPAVNFREGHRYVVALRHLRDADGNPIEARPAFRVFRDGTASLDPRVERRRPQMERIFGDLEAAGIDRSELYLAWDFTVASAESLAGRMLSIRDRAFAGLGDRDLADLEVPDDSRAPAFEVTSIQEYTPDQDRWLARKVHGTFTVPCFLAGGADCSPGQRFVLDRRGRPVRAVKGTVEANFSCNVPRSAIADGGAANPARPSLYGHGLLGSAGETGQWQLRAFGDEHNMLFCATDWDGMSSEDLPIVLGAIIPDLSNFPMLADRVQQGMLNQLFLGRAMIHPDGLGSHPAFQAPDGGSLIDGSRLYYDGNSQGGIIGGALTAVAPDFERAVLGVPGMNYSTLLRRSSDFVSDPPLTVVQQGGEGAGFATFMWTTYPSEIERPLVLSLIQMLWDRAEANGYAQHMTHEPLPNTPAHEVMLHVAFGDHQVAPLSAEVEARTIGARILRKPALDEGRYGPVVDPYWAIDPVPEFPWSGSALVIWDSGSPLPPLTNTADHTGQDPHEHPRRQAAARLQKSEFFKGRVIDVCDGGPCYADPSL